MRRQQVPETIESYTVELRKELVGVLPPEKIDEVLAETQAHLEDRTDELRRSPDIYEARAVSEFIPARKLSRGLIRAWAGVYLRHIGTKWLQFTSMALCIVFFVLFMSMFLFTSWFDAGLKVFIIYFQSITSVLLFTIFFLAVFSCRAQLRRFIYGGLGVIALFSLLGGWLCSFHPYGPISRFDAPEQYKDTLALHQYASEDLQLLNRGILTYDKIIESEEYYSWESIQKQIREVLYRKQKLIAAGVERGTIQNLRYSILSLEAGNIVYQLEVQKKLNKIPSEFKSERKFIVPNEKPRWGGYSPFRAPNKSTYMVKSDILQHQRALVDSWKHSPVEVTDSPFEAVKRWRDAAPQHIRYQTDLAATRLEVLQADQKLVESSLWRFEIAPARFFGTSAAIIVLKILVADFLGGYLGGLMLRFLRRRRSIGETRLKS